MILSASMQPLSLIKLSVNIPKWQFSVLLCTYSAMINLVDIDLIWLATYASWLCLIILNQMCCYYNKKKFTNIFTKGAFDLDT